MPCQQSTLYIAEELIPNKGRDIAPNKLQDYVDAMREHDWWLRNFSAVEGINCVVRDSNRSGSCGGMVSDNWGQIEMAPVHLNELFIVHEVCHVLAQARFKSHAHDPWFARIYLEAVYSYLGSDIYGSLFESFVNNNIDFYTDMMNAAGRIVNSPCVDT